MGHNHHHEISVSASNAGRNKKNLSIVLWLTTSYLVAEVVGGVFTKSLALLADAGHMLTDAGGLALALFAIKLAEKPATPERTYGYFRKDQSVSRLPILNHLFSQSPFMTISKSFWNRSRASV